MVRRIYIYKRKAFNKNKTPEKNQQFYHYYLASYQKEVEKYPFAKFNNSWLNSFSTYSSVAPEFIQAYHGVRVARSFVVSVDLRNEKQFLLHMWHILLQHRWQVMNEEGIGFWLRQTDHIRGHLWYRCSVTVNQGKMATVNLSKWCQLSQYLPC